MEIKRLIVSPFQTNCYIVSQGDHSVLIDPGDDGQHIIEALDKTPDAILLTHGHFDHSGAAANIKEKLSIPVFIHEMDAPMLKGAEESHAARFGYPFAPLSPDNLFCDGDTLSFGPLSFTVLHTPGHTTGSVCFYSESNLFSGDTLFFETIGKFDHKNQNLMAASLKRLCTLPEETRVFPGHGNITSIAHEMQYNPFLQRDWKWEL